MGFEVAAAAARAAEEAAGEEWKAFVAEEEGAAEEGAGARRAGVEAEAEEALVAPYAAIVAARAAEKEALVALAAVGGDEWDIRAAKTAEANVYWMRKYNPSG